MKFITLGTSHGSAETDRFCTCTAFEINGSVYLVDCGAPAEKLLKQYDWPIDKIKTVFITHMHEDHCGGLSAIYKYFRNYTSGEINLCLPEQRGIDGLKSWMKALYFEPKQDRIHFSVVTEGSFYEDENISVTAVANEHLGGMPSFSYRIKAQGKHILFTGDMGTNFFDFKRVAGKEHYDVIFSEFTHWNDVSLACRNLSVANCDRIIFNHLQPGKFEMLPDYQDMFSCELHPAFDGEEFEL